ALKRSLWIMEISQAYFAWLFCIHREMHALSLCSRRDFSRTIGRCRRWGRGKGPSGRSCAHTRLASFPSEYTYLRCRERTKWARELSRCHEQAKPAKKRTRPAACTRHSSKEAAETAADEILL